MTVLRNQAGNPKGRVHNPAEIPTRVETGKRKTFQGVKCNIRENRTNLNKSRAILPNPVIRPGNPRTNQFARWKKRKRTEEKTGLGGTKTKKILTLMKMKK